MICGVDSNNDSPVEAIFTWPPTKGLKGLNSLSNFNKIIRKGVKQYKNGNKKNFGMNFSVNISCNIFFHPQYPEIKDISKLIKRFRYNIFGSVRSSTNADLCPVKLV